MSIDTDTPWIENRPTRGARALDVRELWTYRELALHLALRDVKARYKQAAFGILWAFVQPIAGVAVLTLVFRRLADVPSDGLPYVVFAILGYVAWSYFTGSVSGAMGSLVENSSLLTKLYFPRLLAPLASLLPGLIDLLLGMLLLAGLLVYYGLAPGWAILTLPLWLAGLALVAFGVGLILATVNVRYRDVGSVSGLLLQLWLFASPVAYPSSLVEEPWRWVYALNPMAGVIDGLRWSLVQGPAPGPQVLVSAASGLALLVLGLRYFQGAERRFADVI